MSCLCTPLTHLASLSNSMTGKPTESTKVDAIKFSLTASKQSRDDTSQTDKTLLIRNGFLYCADRENSVIERAWILVNGHVIVAIGSELESPPESDAQLDACGKLILPGFVNPHWHESFVAPNHERADDRNLHPTPYSNGGDIAALGGMFGFISGVGNKLTFAEGRAIARWSMWTQLRSGTTALGDVGSANSADAMAHAALDLGIRLRVSRWGSDIQIDPQSGAIKKIADTEEQTDDWLALLETWNDHPSGLIGGMPSVMGAFGSSNEQLLALGELAHSFTTPYATHLAALKNERQAVINAFGCSSVERFKNLGLLGPNLLAVHPAYTTEEETQWLLNCGAHLCHAPAHYGMLGESSNSETKQFARLIQNGVSLSSSTDGDINYTGGMCEAMRAAHLQHNEILNCNTVCPPTTALKTGTLFAAQALGWADRIGSVEVGKEADLVMVNIQDFRFKTSTHPLRTFLLCASSADIDTVMVRGEVLIQGGQSTHFDEDALYRDYIKAAHSARKRIGAPA